MDKTGFFVFGFVLGLLMCTLVFTIVEYDETRTELEQESEQNKTQFEEYVGGSTIEEVRHNQNTSNINDLEE